MPRRRKSAPPALWFVTFAALAVIVAAVFVIRGRLATTPMTGFGRNAANFGTIDLALDPAAVVDGWPRDRGDATRLYQLAGDAVSLSVLSQRPYSDFLHDSVRTPAREDDLPLLLHLLEAARHATAAPFADEPEALINYERNLKTLDGLYLLGQVAIKQGGLLATRNQAGDADDARRHFEAAFMLGFHLFQERLVHREMELGHRLMSQSLGGLVALAKKQGDAARAARIDERRQRLRDYVNGSLQPVWDRISAINIVDRVDDKADVHMGDVLAIAEHEAADPLWRTEAILRLGKARHDATRPADRAAAERALERLANERDPRLKLAARAALALTAGERMQAR